jgi:hypothetical protein
MKKYIYCFIICSTFLACSAKVEDASPAENPYQTDVGPFELKLSNDTTTQNNSFAVPISQDEGKVEFEFAPKEKTTWMKIRLSDTSAGDCDVKKIEVVKLWRSFKNDPGKIVMDGEMFSAKPQEDGQLTIFFKNITQCSSLAFNMLVDHVNKPSEIPKSWSYDLESALEGTWYSANKDVMLAVTNEYVTLESSGSGYCLVSQEYPMTDITQLPHWLGVFNNKLLCSYTPTQEGDKPAIILSCPVISGWVCNGIKDIKLTKIN